MSEWNHSEVGMTSAGRNPRSRAVPYVVGTIVVALAAAVAFQVYRAEPGMAQSRETQPGKASLSPSMAADEILARVNNEPISYDQVARECFERHGKETLDNIINRRMIEQECERNGVQITQAEIQQEVIDIARKFNVDVANWYALLKNERGIDQLQYHRDVIYPMLALKRLAGKNIQVTNDDIQKAFVRDYGPRVEARMIALNDNQRHAQEVWQKVKNDPENFHRYAQELSADPNSRSLGGVIPPIRRNSGNSTIEAEAFKLAVGEISPLIEVGQSSYVILKCEGQTAPVVTDIRQVWDELSAQVTEEKTQETVAKVFKDVHDRARVINHLTGQATGGTAPAGAGQTSATQAIPGAIQQTSATQPAAARQPVQNAAYTAPAGNTR